MQWSQYGQTIRHNKSGKFAGLSQRGLIAGSIKGCELNSHPLRQRDLAARQALKGATLHVFVFSVAFGMGKFAGTTAAFHPTDHANSLKLLDYAQGFAVQTCWVCTLGLHHRLFLDAHHHRS